MEYKLKQFTYAIELENRKYVFEGPNERHKHRVMQESIIDLIHHASLFRNQTIDFKICLLLIIQDTAILCDCLGLHKWLIDLIAEVEKQKYNDNLRFEDAFLLQKHLLFYQHIHHDKYAKVRQNCSRIKLLKEYLTTLICELNNIYQLYYYDEYKLDLGQYIDKYVF